MASPVFYGKHTHKLVGRVDLGQTVALYKPGQIDKGNLTLYPCQMYQP